MNSLPRTAKLFAPLALMKPASLLVAVGTLGCCLMLSGVAAAQPAAGTVGKGVKPEGPATPEMLAAMNRLNEAGRIPGRPGSLTFFRWNGAKPPALAHLGLWGPKIDNDLLAVTSTMPALEFVSPYETCVTDDGIRAAIGTYDVQAIDSLIGDITPPAELMLTQTDHKIAEERRKTYQVQEAAQIQRQQLVRQTSLAGIQQQVVGAEQGVNIAELQASANVKQATGEAEATRLHTIGEAEAIRATGQAKAEAYRVGVEAIGAQGYTVMQFMQIIGERNVRIVPDVAVTGANGSTGLVDGLLGVMLKAQSAKAA